MAYFRKRGNKWSFTVDVGRDPVTNERRQITRSGFKSKPEAKEACDLVVAQYEANNQIMDAEKMTVEDFFKMWLETYARPNLALTTYENRLYVVNGRIIPGLGKNKLKDLNAIKINKFYTSLYNDGYQSSYIKSIHSILRTAMKHAVKWDLLSKNFMDKVDVPKMTKKNKITWTIDQINHYFDTAKKDMDSNYYIAILICGYAGVRRGEALGLRWSDINFENNVFAIEQAIADTRSKGAHIQGTKTESSKRQVELPTFLAAELKWHKAKQNQTRLKFGDAYNDNNLVACKPNGDPLYPRYLLEKHQKHCENIGLNYIPIHGLRHTHATALLEAGVHPKIVQERLGHSSISITLDLYSHVTPNMQKEAVQKFDEIMNRK